MRFRFRREAREELYETAARYAAEREGLGEEFMSAVREAVDRVVEYPQRAALYRFGARAYRLNRFPYRLIYVVEQKELVFLTVMHTSRDDAYCKPRLKPPAND